MSNNTEQNKPAVDKLRSYGEEFLKCFNGVPIECIDDVLRAIQIAASARTKELEEENKRLKAALTEVKEIEYDYSQSKTTLCATLWHVIKVASKAISPSTNEKE